MANRMFTTSAAMLAVVAGLGTAAIAQTAPAATDLPAPLAGLNLRSLEIDTKSDGIREIDGRTADGVEIEARIDMAGNLIEVESDDGVLPQSLVEAMLTADLRGHQAMDLFGSITEIKQRPDHVEVSGRQSTGSDIDVKFDRQNALIGIEMDDTAIPADLVNTLLPQAVRDSEVFGQFGRIEEIGLYGGRVMLEGEDAGGRDMRAALDQDGRVLRFGREGGPDRSRDERRGDRRAPEAGSRGAAAQFDTVAVNQRLTEAGYSGFGLLRPEGPRLTLQATNPQGEPVTLELDPRGEVIRETAR